MVERIGSMAATGIIAGILLVTAAVIARPIVEPLAYALFIIALAAPLQASLERKLPKLIALALTLAATMAVLATLGWVIAWAFGRVARDIVANFARFQTLYADAVAWLEGHGVPITGLVADHLNVGLALRVIQDVTGRLNTLASFATITLVLVMLGLLEIDVTRRKLERIGGGDTGAALIRAAVAVGERFRRYMIVRTQMSLVTGLLVFAFAKVMGLGLAAEWGAMAFVLNYIPFIGPFIATLMPTVFAMMEFDTWQAVIVLFLCLNLIQFMVGSYLEPLVAGNALALSPFVVLLAVFLWSFLWGLSGAFIGVPIVIAGLAIAAEFPASRWVADLLADKPPP